MTEMLIQLPKGYISKQLKCMCVSQTGDKEKYNHGHEKWKDSLKVSVDQVLFKVELELL